MFPQILLLILPGLCNLMYVWRLVRFRCRAAEEVIFEGVVLGFYYYFPLWLLTFSLCFYY